MAAIAAGQAPLRDEAEALVTRWAAGGLGAGDVPWSRPGWLAEALAWVATQAGQISDVEQVRVSAICGRATCWSGRVDAPSRRTWANAARP
ncbi:MAG TPA: hypothetical protein VFP65_02555 [Anaeromyxobacteraceae bacterium]|nr:hypothetical protein [Anaeromyxobacteraceae bacterium]